MEDLNKITRHHRRPKSQGLNNEPENISYIKLKHHKAWHLIFADMTPEEIAEEINKKYLDPAFRMVVKPTGYKHPNERRKK